MNHYFFEVLLKTVPLAVIAVDENLIVRAVSSEAETLLDIKADSIVGSHIKNCCLLGKSGLQNLEKTLEEGLEANDTYYLYSEDVGGKEARLLTRRVEDPGGKVLGAVLLIDAPGRFDDSKKIVNSEKIELAQQMAIGIAHHIRNPLTAVRGFIQILQNKTDDQPVTGFQEFSAIALKELDRVNNVISNLLQFTDSSPTKREIVNIGSLLENVLTFIKAKVAVSGILLIKEIPPDLPNTSIDLVRVIHALFNILDNAIQSMPEGGQLIIKCHVLPGKKKVCIEIGDSGAGIPGEELSKIFNPFYSTKGEGMGFGLALANKIIHEHDGEIRVLSEVGKGSTFLVFLPVCTEKQNTE
ncbi:MAG TPA: ATP-binding protein [Bacillota bacterium]|nr:ATP-binding protein [Bacillota bacterium]